MQSDVKTFRGRTLEELLPRIREELGPDAIVLRRREGLSGGLGGFFQRSFVEVDARRGQPGELPLEARNDRATTEGLSAPGVQALIQQAAPFADALARAEGTVADRAGEVLLAAARGEVPVTRQATPAAAVPAGLYGPQPAAPAPTPPAPAVAHVLPAQDFVADAPPVAQAAAPAIQPLTVAPPPAPRAEVIAPPPLAPERPAAADAAEQRLVAAGLSQELASDIVREAVVHGLPFTSPRNIKKLVRNVLAGRIDVFRHLSTEPRTIALVGGGGAGKTSTVAYIAASYVAVGADVAVISLRGDTTLAARLQPLGVAVIQAKDGEQAKKRLGAARPLLTLIDTPAVGLSSTPGEIKGLAAELKLLEVTEVHLALPATLSAAAADELSEALAPLGATHVVLSHADETKRPGAPIELALKAGHPLSYICARSGVSPADPAELAAQLLP